MSSPDHGALQSLWNAGDFAHGFGDLGKRIQAYDWSATPLGPIHRWPQSLRTVVSILLSSRYAMWMAWGPELTFLCNDAYRPTLGIKFPWALGAPANQVWAEIWPDIGPRINSVLRTGKATYDEGLLLFLERSGFPEETYHTFSYSPLAGDNGRITGMLCVVTEETNRVIGERRVETLRNVASALTRTNSEDQVLLRLAEQLGANLRDLPFTLTYLYDAQGNAHRGCSSGISPAHPLAPDLIPAGSNTPWLAHDIRANSTAHLISPSNPVELPKGDWSQPVNKVLITPIAQQGQSAAAGFLVTGLNPFCRYDNDYSGFINLLAGQIAAALANARAYEQERRRAEALAEIDKAKTTFFSNVSHELRTPLTLILSPVEELLAHRDGLSPDASGVMLNMVHRNALRLQKLVNALLDFSRIEAGRVQASFRPTDLNALTSELAANFRSAMQKAGLAFHVDCLVPAGQPVYVDHDMWEKVVLNLLSNALKFTFEGSVSVTLRQQDAHVVLSVSDTGVGIPAVDIPHIFDRFYRVTGATGRTIEGTGIGLALVHELVKLHGGAVSVESQLGQGTTFTVRIPLVDTHLPKQNLHSTQLSSTALSSGIFVEEAFRWLEADPAEHLSPPPANHVKSETVLIADDNADMREYLSRLLDPHYHLIVASNGSDALAAALKHHPDLVLTDVMMPGLDGFGLLRALRSNNETKTIPVVMLSARAGEESRVEGLDAGADDYLVKPFTARELMARLNAHLSLRKLRLQAEAAVRENQAILHSFYESSPYFMGISEIDGDDIINLYSNPACRHFMALVPEQMENRPVTSFGVSETMKDYWIEKFRESQRTGRPVRHQVRYPGPDGLAWIDASFNYLGDGPSGRPRFSFIAEDITDRKHQEEMLRLSNEQLRQANFDLEQFAYCASHDLQEPLRQIVIYSQMLDRKYHQMLDGKASEYLSFCVEGAKRIENLISDLLSYSQASKSAPAEVELVDVAGIIEQVKQTLASAILESKASIHYDQLPVIGSNRVPLTHVFQNLISNAIKYRNERPLVITIGAQRFEGFWQFQVSDNGIGIPQQFQAQIFGIFKRLHDRRQYPGTGIGLAICQKIVERYGGRIWVDSVPDEGSTFSFTIPDLR